jgi:hypothetical protein
MAEFTKDMLIVKWVEALRTGEHRQGKSALCSRDGYYCCLGVAGKLLGLSDEYMQVNAPTSNHAYGEIRTAYGLRDELGHYDGGALSRHNDIEGLTFAQIADIIESRPEGLFV